MGTMFLLHPPDTDGTRNSGGSLAMVTRLGKVHCNICESEMGPIIDGTFRPHPYIHQGGYLRLQVHDMHTPPVIYDCDYCPSCSKRVSIAMKELKIWVGC